MPNGNTLGGTFYHSGGVGDQASAAEPITPTQAQGIVAVDNAHLDTANVKRVIALTRAGGNRDPQGYNDELDGTQMTSFFSGGQVRRRNEELPRHWQPVDVNQAET
ncbi:MAG TPA: hypothetical protein VF627_12705, partial [Abditibacterium sp.]